MSDYDLSLTGAQIDSALNKVHNADTTPILGSQNMVTSNGIRQAIASSEVSIDTDLSTGVNTNDTVPSSLAVENYLAPQIATLERSSEYSTQSTSTTGNLPSVGLSGLNITVNNGQYTIQPGIYGVMMKAELSNENDTNNTAVLKLEMQGGEPSPGFSLNEVFSVSTNNNTFIKVSHQQILNCQTVKTFNVYFYRTVSNFSFSSAKIKNFKMVFLKLA